MWTPRYSKLFDQQISEYREANVHSRIDDVVDGVEWALAHDPHAFPQVEETHLRVVETDEVDAVPALHIAYSIDDEDKSFEFEFVVEIPEFAEEDTP